MKITLDLTGILAIWGAVLSTIAIFWDIYKWRTSGPSLHMRVSTGMVAYNMPVYEGRTLIMVSVTNRGDRPTTITHLNMAYYDTWWKAILCMKPSQNYWVANPNTFQQVPFELKPGIEWKGMIEQNSEIEIWAQEGYLYATLNHSHNKKPMRQRIVIRKPKSQ
jgi:hypothetical protein